MMELYIWGECLSGGWTTRVCVRVCLCFVNVLTRFRPFNLFCHIQMMSNWPWPVVSGALCLKLSVRVYVYVSVCLCVSLCLRKGKGSFHLISTEHWNTAGGLHCKWRKQREKFRRKSIKHLHKPSLIWPKQSNTVKYRNTTKYRKKQLNTDK